METKLGVFSDVRNKSEPLQYVHAMQVNWRFIVMLVEGYIPVIISSKAIMREWQNKHDAIENRDTCLPIYRWWKQIDIAQA